MRDENNFFKGEVPLDVLSKELIQLANRGKYKDRYPRNPIVELKVNSYSYEGITMDMVLDFYGDEKYDVVKLDVKRVLTFSTSPIGPTEDEVSYKVKLFCASFQEDVRKYLVIRKPSGRASFSVFFREKKERDERWNKDDLELFDYFRRRRLPVTIIDIVYGAIVRHELTSYILSGAMLSYIILGSYLYLIPFFLQITRLILRKEKYKYIGRYIDRYLDAIDDAYEKSYSIEEFEVNLSLNTGVH